MLVTLSVKWQSSYLHRQQLFPRTVCSKRTHIQLLHSLDLVCSMGKPAQQQ